MVNYSEGKIYKIVSQDDPDYPYYIGGTCKKYLSQRMVQHKQYYKKWLEGKQAYLPEFELFVKFGMDRCKIVLVERFKCETKDELNAREAHYINQPGCLNNIVQ